MSPGRPSPVRRRLAWAAAALAVTAAAGAHAAGRPAAPGADAPADEGAAAPPPGIAAGPRAGGVTRGAARPRARGAPGASVVRGPGKRARYLDGPPPGHTGGFDEPTCRACHFDRPLNPPPGEVRLEGVPEAYAPDSTYAITVVVAQPELRGAGFQLAARWTGGSRKGCSAGRLGSTGPRTDTAAVRDTTSAVDGPASGGGGARSGPGPRPGDGDRPAAGARSSPGDRSSAGCTVVYLHQTEAGAEPTGAGRSRWRVRWTAPRRSLGAVAFHVAANAANDDASEFGDRIYAAEAVSESPR